ncbi:MAG: CRTAC1 family protein [Planctomycetota bacterium]|nr:CRTAC1 family protein [Planctomycetota bacterium]
MRGWHSRCTTWSALCAALCLGDAAPAASPILLRDVTRQTGITFQHTDGSSGRRYIVETVASGVATFDYDGDGLTDIFFLNGSPLAGAAADPPSRPALYRNCGGGTFQEMTLPSGLGKTGYGLAVAVGDYDNDGYPDVYVSHFGPNVFYRNNGDGTFTDVTIATGTAGGDSQKVGAGVSFLDADGDGCLDLFVANYLRFSNDRHVTALRRGVPVYASPEQYPPWPAALYHNRGDGTFSDVSRESGVSQSAGRGMGIVCADYDNDGSTDIFVANDGSPNSLLHNDGRGRFQDVGVAAGIAYDYQGRVQGSMGVDCGDYDNDGLLDFYKTAFQRQMATLYRNLGRGLFDDVTLVSGAGAGTSQNVTWGCAFVDLDNDGDRDLFVACGHVYDNVERFDDTTSYRARNLVLQNILRETGQAKFVDISDRCGDGLQARQSSRGVAADDLDNDGAIDLVVLNSRALPTIVRNLLNETGSHNHWLDIRLQGRRTNRDGVGAQVKVVAGDLIQLDEVHSGRGYQSHYGTRLHFGLGPHDRADRIEVRWIGGGVDVLKNVAVDRSLLITEGSGQPGFLGHGP